MYTHLPESYYIDTISNKETIMICSILLVSMLLIFIYHITKANKIKIITNYNKNELSKLDSKNRKKAKRYYKTIDARNREDLRVHRFGILASAFMFFLILTAGCYQYNQPNLYNYIADIEQKTTSKDIEPSEFEIFVNLQNNRIDLFKVKDIYYQKVNGEYIEIKNPNLFDFKG